MITLKLNGTKKYNHMFIYQKPEFYYLHIDRLGSGSAVTDGRGRAVHPLGYMTYGETLLDFSQGGYKML